MFCGKNQSMPFTYKKTVFEALLAVKLLYSCELWFTENVKAIDKQYIGAMKSLLGVRKQISNEVVLIELGVQDLRDHIHKYRKNFIKSKLSDPTSLCQLFTGFVKGTTPKVLECFNTPFFCHILLQRDSSQTNLVT